MRATTSKTQARATTRRTAPSSRHRPRRRRGVAGRESAAGGASATRASLGTYLDAAGRVRELVAVGAAAGSVLVVDRDGITLGDRRLVAHLAADEPTGNALALCEQYIADPTRGRCRPVAATDLEAEPPAYEPDLPSGSAPTLVDDKGRSYGLEAIPSSRAVPDLRWVAREPCGRWALLSVRDVIARLESYEPARALTRVAVARHGHERRLSVSVLKAELERVDSSPIVLNRRLREAVLRTIRTQEVSASEIAVRCGRVKRDARGNISGETSWLARRVGLVPEGGAEVPTPWIHSDVLALIARRGLGLSPRDVELG